MPGACDLLRRHAPRPLQARPTRYFARFAWSHAPYLPITSFGAVVMASPCRAARILSRMVGKIGVPRGALGRAGEGRLGTVAKVHNVKSHPSSYCSQ